MQFCVADVDVQGIGWLFMSVPSKAVAGDACIGKRTPIQMIAIMAKIFINVNQYSISPYLRTFKQLMMMGIGKNIAIQTAALIVGNQKAMILVIEMSFPGNPNK